LNLKRPKTISILSEGKPEPSYHNSDIFQVTLVLNAKIEDKAFFIFIQHYKLSKKEPQLGVEQIIALCRINKSMFTNLDANIVEELEKTGLIEKVGTSSSKYVLSEPYRNLYDQTIKIGNRYLIEEIKVLIFALQDKKLKIVELENRLNEYLNRNQIKYLLSKLQQDGILDREGSGKGTCYFIHKQFDKFRGEALMNEITILLKSKYK